ncbi:MAG: family peptidase [Thermoproteota archaeon]|nr:family peptidase [Thermoproteota archaeon]
MLDSNQEKIRIPKILAPVKSLEGAERVIKAGADEIYCGVTIDELKEFVLYRGPDSEIPTYDELGKVVKYAHNHSVKTIVTVNNPFMLDMFEKPIRNHVRRCLDEGVDAFIVGDIGVISLIKSVDENVPLYASTYMISTNSEAVEFLRKRGLNRVVLERQLTINELQEIVRRSKVDIEIFIHGGGCGFINGSCYLYHFDFPSLNYAADMSESLIKSPCAWDYKVSDLSQEKKELGYIPILDALEFCSLCNLPELIKIGVAGFKLEGRDSCLWYQESTTKIYRELVNMLATGELSSFKERIKSLKNGDFVPFPPTFLSVDDFCCQKRRCYYNSLLHAPYKVPLSWQTRTKSIFKTLVCTR